MRWGLLLLVVCAGALPGQERTAPATLTGPQAALQDSLLNRLAGRWTMSGAVRGKPVIMNLDADWVLQHHWLRLLMTDTGTPPAYEANVYIGDDPVGKRFVAHWLDNFGGWWSETLGYARHPSGSAERTAMTFVFDYPDGPFHTTFTLGKDLSTWSVLMQDRGPDGDWREFAHYALRRRT
ncbi:MAG TPA: hypothetical protein VLT79_00855 [Gemmatimonadales bacterium]|nr:hypothetical protein [Gemmatimonadales bacterium]